jgi:hypothetical protein
MAVCIDCRLYFGGNACILSVCFAARVAQALTLPGRLRQHVPFANTQQES